MILNYLSVLLIWLSVCLDDTELSVWTISPARISFGSICGSGVTLLAFSTVLTKYTLGFPFTAFAIMVITVGYPLLKNMARSELHLMGETSAVRGHFPGAQSGRPSVG